MKQIDIAQVAALDQAATKLSIGTVTQDSVVTDLLGPALSVTVESQGKTIDFYLTQSKMRELADIFAWHLSRHPSKWST